jgi:RalA-binding protein 1
MAATTPSNRIEMARGPPRTSSIDSAISSISIGKHSHNSSQDSNSRGAADIANLVHAAGSAEAVIQHLLKEKQSQAAQNSQLWRLVDKQRAMILGLNKDLERALKDKERYRKKLKESLGQLSAPSSESKTSGGTSSSNSRTVEEKKNENVEALVSIGLRNPQASQEEIPSSPIDVALAPYPITPPPAIQTVNIQPLANLVEAEHKMPAPTEHAFLQYDADAPPAGFGMEQQQQKAAEVVRELPYNASVPPSRSLPASPPRITTSDNLALKPTPTLAIIEASPNVDYGEPKFPLPPRKPPPAPLKLGKTDTSSHLHRADSVDSEESDYDDVLEVEEIPAVTERGRRRTREEDDREREIAAARDAELRSLSKKSKSRPTTPKETKVKAPVPPIIRQTVQISPPDAHLQVMSPANSLAGSLAGILNASGSDRASDGGSQRGISPPALSPGLPLSPRPIDRGVASSIFRNPRDGSGHSSLASPPMSPRGMGAFPSAMPLSPRAPRQPIPLPPNTPMSLASPGMSKNQPFELVSPKPLHVTRKPGVNDNDSPKDSNSSVSDRHAIYQGFVTDEYPDLLLPPNALPSIDVRVASSRLKPSRASLMFPMKLDDDPVFTLAVFARTDDRELWRVEKDSLSLAQLDQQLKQSETFIAKMPEKSLFSGHAPAKIDARRVALDKYFDEVLNTQLDTKTALAVCKYLSTNTMEPNAEDSTASGDSARDSPTGPGGRPMRSGYLTKRGKNFGGWKARFFVLDGPILKYYEAPGGAHLGAIKLQNAQIGKQQQHPENQSPSRGDTDDTDNEYRHAFLILEPKRKDSSSLVRHVLCAESDKERDQWVEALLRYVDYRDSEDEDSGHQAHARNGSEDSRHVTGLNAKKKIYGQGRALNVSTPDADDNLRGISYEETAQGETPSGVKQRGKSGTPPPTNGYDREPMVQSLAISGPKNATIIQDTGAWGNKQSSLVPAPDDKIKQKKRSFFGFGPKPRGSGDVQDNSIDSSTNLLSQMSYEQHGPIRAVFGAPLADAVRYNHPVDADIELPAVVYRCIEYLDARNAAAEEGIFRLSGSNVVIKSLRERFNVEGDVNLITDDQYYDIHAVASLLKLYLRELPTTILTRELHLDFLAVTELHDLQEKISALNGLVHRLPRANGALLRYLSGFLINIINHSDVNKMTVRNVGIVFSPTLNIPAPVFALFLQQYDGIFGSELDQHDRSPIEVTVTAPPLTPDDIRSPRKQHFQELPTPSYDQQSFPRTPVSFPHSSQHNQQRALHDTGFTPLQPTYENTVQQATIGGLEHGSRTQGPSYEQHLGGNVVYRQYNSEQASRAKKRESSIFTMTMGPKKPNFGKVKEESRRHSVPHPKGPY